MEAWSIVLVVLAVLILAVLLYLFFKKTRTGRSLIEAICPSNGSVRSINLRSVGDCGAICAEIRSQLRKVSFVDDPREVTVVVTLKTTRVQSDAESALEQIGHYPENRHRVILLMFHKVVGSKTLEDVEAVMYQNPDVKKTFHVPYQL